MAGSARGAHCCWWAKAQMRPGVRGSNSPVKPWVIIKVVGGVGNLTCDSPHPTHCCYSLLPQNHYYCRAPPCAQASLHSCCNTPWLTRAEGGVLGGQVVSHLSAQLQARGWQSGQAGVRDCRQMHAMTKKHREHVEAVTAVGAI